MNLNRQYEELKDLEVPVSEYWKTKSIEIINKIRCSNLEPLSLFIEDLCFKCKLKQVKVPDFFEVSPIKNWVELEWKLNSNFILEISFFINSYDKKCRICFKICYINNEEEEVKEKIEVHNIVLEETKQETYDNITKFVETIYGLTYTNYDKLYINS